LNIFYVLLVIYYNKKAHNNPSEDAMGINSYARTRRYNIYLLHNIVTAWIVLIAGSYLL